MVVLQQIWLSEIIGGIYWCVKISQCGYIDHGLRHISFYVKTCSSYGYPALLLTIIDIKLFTDEHHTWWQIGLNLNLKRTTNNSSTKWCHYTSGFYIPLWLSQEQLYQCKLIFKPQTAVSRVICLPRPSSFRWITQSLTHWGQDTMAAISQTTLWSAFSLKKMSQFQLKFRWSLSLRVQLTIFQHCFR